MITKAKKVQFTTTDGRTCDTIEEAKRIELGLLSETGQEDLASKAFSVLVTKPREAIAILRVGLPRKPRTVKAKAGRGRKNSKPDFEETPRVKSMKEIVESTNPR